MGSTKQEVQNRKYKIESTKQEIQNRKYKMEKKNVPSKKLMIMPRAII